ncbi:MAG: hypothetical protein KKC68_02700, partial [Candidatus Thermoplasmatota archaeon]|nr:hypothetical protein [Candidatus Thermoplasmatota archaeon]
IVKTWEPGETQILKLGPILGFGASTSMLHATLKVKNVTDTTNVPWKGFLFLTCPMIHPISFYFQWR